MPPLIIQMTGVASARTMYDYFGSYLETQKSQKGFTIPELLNKALIMLVVVIVALWLLSPVRDKIGSWMGYKSRTELIQDNAQLSKNLDVAVEVNKSNEKLTVIHKEIEKEQAVILVKETDVKKDVTVKVRQRVDTMHAVTQKIEQSTELTEKEKDDQVAREVIRSLWDTYNATRS